MDRGRPDLLKCVKHSGLTIHVKVFFSIDLTIYYKLELQQYHQNIILYIAVYSIAIYWVIAILPVFVNFTYLSQSLYFVNLLSRVKCGKLKV